VQGRQAGGVSHYLASRWIREEGLDKPADWQTALSSLKDKGFSLSDLSDKLNASKGTIRWIGILQ